MAQPKLVPVILIGGPEPWETSTFGNKSKSKETLTQIFSWNIRTLLDSVNSESLTIPRRSAIVTRELKRYKVDIAALQEEALEN